MNSARPSSNTVIDEMFPEGSSGNMMELDEVLYHICFTKKNYRYYKMKCSFFSKANTERRLQHRFDSVRR
jgi:hypothetical protein